MLLVVDVNVIFSALYSKGVAFEVFAINSMRKYFELVAPEYAFLELDNNMGELQSKSTLPPEEINSVLEFIKGETRIIPSEEFDRQVPEAFKTLEKHPKDAPYLALALKLGCKILSGDKKLRGLIPDKVTSPREALTELLMEEP